MIVSGPQPVVQFDRCAHPIWAFPLCDGGDGHAGGSGGVPTSVTANNSDGGGNGGGVDNNPETALSTSTVEGYDVSNSNHDDEIVPVHMKRTQLFDNHRFEKISNIIKQFKLSVGKAQSQFQGMEVRNSRFSAFIDAFTANTYIMVIVSNPDVHTAATLLNIQNARTHFEKFILSI